MDAATTGASNSRKKAAVSFSLSKSLMSVRLFEDLCMGVRKRERESCWEEEVVEHQRHCKHPLPISIASHRSPAASNQKRLSARGRGRPENPSSTRIRSSPPALHRLETPSVERQLKKHLSGEHLSNRKIVWNGAPNPQEQQCFRRPRRLSRRLSKKALRLLYCIVLAGTASYRILDNLTRQTKDIQLERW